MSDLKDSHVGGLLTFVFTDIVSSTRLWQDHPHDMAAALAVHDDLVRRITDDHDGFVFTTAGDAFGLGFERTASGLEAALDIQRALHMHDWGKVEIIVRVGLHTGSAQRRDGGCFGPEVNRAARIRDAARGHQVLVSSEAVESLTSENVVLPSLVDVGSHTLKSVDGTTSLHLVDADFLSCDRGIDAVPSGALPTAIAGLVGRTSELAATQDALETSRLVTITGLGGVGKTRLAVEATHRLAPSFPDGAWWIDLSPIPDGVVLPELVAATLGLSHQTDTDALTALAEALSRRHLLLVLDNAEHTIPSVRTALDRLLAAAPDLRVLVTSREPLDAQGERVIRLDGLDPATDGRALLVRLARDAGLDPEAWSERDLIELATRLDGLPLALEMAAGRFRGLAPRDIVQRLDDRFRLLRRRDTSDERRRSVEATLDWSYDLLEPDERVVLDHLSILGSAFGIELAAAVVAMGDWEVVDFLDGLVKRSLVVAEPGGGRWRLLETVRFYARSHLDQATADRLRRRHLDAIHERIGGADADVLDASAERFLRGWSTIGTHWDHIRDAVACATDLGDTERCGDLLRWVWTFSWETARIEVGGWAERALTMNDVPPVAYAVAAMTTKGGTRRALALAKEGMRLIDASTPHPDAALLCSVLHGLTMATGDPEARRYAEDALFHAAVIGAHEVAFNAAHLAAIESDLDRARALLQPTYAYLAEAESPLVVVCVPAVASVEARLGEPPLAHRRCAEAVRVADRYGFRWTGAMAAAEQARIAMRYDLGSPATEFADALRVCRSNRAWYALYLLLGRSLYWFGASGRASEQALVLEHLVANRIDYALPRSFRPDPGSPPPVSVLDRDSLVEELIDRLSETFTG